MIKSHYSIAELVTLGLPCLPKSDRGIEMRIGRENWPFVEVKAKGGRGGVRREYQPTFDVMAAIKQVAVDRALKSTPSSVATVISSGISSSTGASIPTPLSTVTVVTQAGALKDWQKRTAEARAALLREVERIAAIVGVRKPLLK